ncbi:MAG: dihydroorotate dehydrogenase electron transfer subunit [Pirellulales bacterium]
MTETATHQVNPIHAAFYADHACQSRVRVLENVRLARDTYRVRLACPEIAARIVPGQFVMLRLAGVNDPLLGRPLALYDTVLDGAGAPVGVDIVYLVVGKLTRCLAGCQPGQELDIWGPLGNGFPARPTEHLILVAGGIGQTPFLALGQEYRGMRQYGQPLRSVPPVARVTLCYGVRNAEFAAGVSDFQAAGFDVRLSSDDGSIGHHGLVTELLRRVLHETAGDDRLVVCCGPEPMMEAVAGICHAAAAPCLVSLETPMACGIGICFSCVTKVRQPDDMWDYKRTCVEGPIFDAAQIEW